MTDDEFLRQFEYLVKKYIEDEKVSEGLIREANALGADAAKGLMHDFNHHAGPVETIDAKIIKDIAFYFI